MVVFPLAALEAATGASPVAGRKNEPVGVGEDFGGVRGEEDVREEADIPIHLMSPEGLRAVLALSGPDSEELN